MSVVVYKDGVMAADSLAYGGKYQTPAGEKRKIHKLVDGSIVGIVSAVLGDPEHFLLWLNGERDPDDWKGDKPDVRALRVDPAGQVWLYDNSLYPSGPIQCSRYAIGSGGDFALGAMAMGADPVQAVTVACQFDSHCGGPIHTLELRH